MSTICIKSSLGQLSSLITSGSRGWAQFYSDSGALFLRMTNLPKEGIALLLSDNKYVELPSASKEGKRTNIKQNDILISITAELGRIGFVENNLGEAYVNQHVALIRINHSDVDPKYLAYYLAATPQRNLWQRLNDSGAKSALNLQTISNFPISLPSLPEQNIIADMLFTWDSAIETMERLIEVKEKRFQWLLNELINKPASADDADKCGWGKMKLEEICKVTKGKQLNVAHMKEDGEYYALNGGIEPSGRTDDWNTEANTITISEGGNSCGFVNFNRERFWSGGHCYSLFNLNKTVSREYLFFFLKLAEPKLMKLRVGSGLPNIQKKDVDKFAVDLPSPKEQKKIAETFNIAQKEIGLLRDKHDLLKKQKRGLMQKLLTGQWRVKA